MSLSCFYRSIWFAALLVAGPMGAATSMAQDPPAAEESDEGIEGSEEEESSEDDPQEEPNDKAQEDDSEEAAKPQAEGGVDEKKDAEKAEKNDTEKNGAEKEQAGVEEQESGELPKEVVLKEFVTIPLVGVYGRASVHIDPIDAAMADGSFKLPKAGDKFDTGAGREVSWRSATTGENGTLSTRSIRGGYAVASFDSPAAGILRLEATGHAMVYVNGLPYAGDPYAYGNFALPVWVKKGENTLVFHVAQSELTARLVKPSAEVLMSTDRAVLPSLVRGDKSGERWASVTVANYSDKPLTELSIEAEIEGSKTTTTPVEWFDAATVRSCPLEFAVPDELKGDVATLQLRLMQDDLVLGQLEMELEVVEASAMQTRTFVSRIDRSVQPYLVVPASKGASGDAAHLVAQSDEKTNSTVGAIVALHTDGMTPRDFAMQYKPKSWAHVIVPGGRGEFPLDWEEWSRMDADEALADAEERFDIDADRIYVTGHGMGGHGALVLATSLPDRFAAVATAAAWPSLWTYGGGMPDYEEPSNVEAILLRAARPSDTLAQLVNLATVGVYLTHGVDDEQIPAKLSRQIVEQLATWHNDFALYLKPEAGNWWGEETVDSDELMRFLAARRRNPDVAATRVRLATSDLGTLATSQWLTIASQNEQFAISEVDLQLKSSPLSIVGTTKNVKRMRIDRSVFDEVKPFMIRLDGGPAVLVPRIPSGGLWLEKVEKQWVQRPTPPRSDKGPTRYGGMKAVFDHNVVLVYGTIGNKEENAWSRAKAHFDAQTFAYRANGAIEVLSDVEFIASVPRDRNVVFYGSVDTNKAWARLMSSSPVQAGRGRFRVDTRPESGDDLGYVVVRPRTGTTRYLVAAVGGTGIEGMRLTNRLRYFWAGTPYPDLLLIGPDALYGGDDGVRAAGYFGENWNVDNAEMAWRDLAL